MKLYLLNPSNPLVSIVNVSESRWNRYRVWKPLSLMVFAGLTPPEWEITIVDENLGAPDYQSMPRPEREGTLILRVCHRRVMIYWLRATPSAPFRPRADVP